MGAARGVDLGWTGGREVGHVDWWRVVLILVVGRVAVVVPIGEVVVGRWYVVIVCRRRLIVRWWRVVLVVILGLNVRDVAGEIRIGRVIR